MKTGVKLLKHLPLPAKLAHASACARSTEPVYARLPETSTFASIQPQVVLVVLGEII
jgi:hypothetical protein